MYTLGLTTAASVAMANPAAPHISPRSTTTVQPHGNPRPTTTKPTTVKAPSGATTPTTTKLNPIAAKITARPQLDSKITAMLPTGMTLNQASMGFKNQGQFIAALHVSQNLGIPFSDLRTQMVKNDLSLGQAIQKLKGTSDRTAVEAAEKQAGDDIKTTTSSTSTTSSGKKNGK